jgi:hypothetical protein
MSAIWHLADIAIEVRKACPSSNELARRGKAVVVEACLFESRPQAGVEPDEAHSQSHSSKSATA